MIELMIVVAIIGTLAGIAVPSVQAGLRKAKIQRAVVDITNIGNDIATYEMEHGHVPDDLAMIGRDKVKDPWGRPYEYLSFHAAGPSWKGKARKDHSMVPLNSSFDLYSLGPDGLSVGPLTAKASRDDIVRANDGGYIGLASEF